MTTTNHCTGCTCGPRRYHVDVAHGSLAGLRCSAFPVCHAWAVRLRSALSRPADFALVEATDNDAHTACPGCGDIVPDCDVQHDWETGEQACGKCRGRG